MQINVPNKIIVVLAALVAAPVLFAAGQVSQIAKQQAAPPEETRRQIVDTIRRQVDQPPEPRAGIASQVQPPPVSSTELSRQPMAAVLKTDPVPAVAAVEEPVSRAAGVGDVVALWVKSSEWSRSVALSAHQDSGMAAKPIMVVGMITNLTETHVTLGGRKWFNGRSYEDDKFYDIELIPRDIVYRVQVIGVSGQDFDQDVVVNTAPTSGFAPLPLGMR